MLANSKEFSLGYMIFSNSSDLLGESLKVEPHVPKLLPFHYGRLNDLNPVKKIYIRGKFVRGSVFRS